MINGNVFKKGDVSIFIIAITTMFILLILVMFSFTIMNINFYSIVYNYKMDLYNLNRSAIMSVNKVEGKYGIYKYNKQIYLSKFKELLQKAYLLNNNLSNGNKFIKEIKILEYEVIYKGEVDNITSKILNNDVVHVLTTIEYQPILFKKLFPNNCIFTLHNDISIKMYE